MRDAGLERRRQLAAVGGGSRGGGQRRRSVANAGSFGATERYETLGRDRALDAGAAAWALGARQSVVCGAPGVKCRQCHRLRQCLLRRCRWLRR